MLWKEGEYGQRVLLYNGVWVDEYNVEWLESEKEMFPYD